MRSPAQYVTDRLARPGARHRTAWLARRALLLLADPPVWLQIERERLRLPLSHHLPAIRGQLPDYASNVGRAAAAARAAKGEAAMIDVGANVGDTVAILRAAVPGARVLAVEGAAEHLALLRANVGHLDGVEVAPAYLGDESRTLRAEREVRRGSGRLVPGGEGPGQVDVVTLDRLLESHPAFGSAGFLKVDTDGFDARVLRGSVRYLERARPVVFFELHPALLAQSDPGGEAILGLMHELGYHHGVLYTERGEMLAALRTDRSETCDDLIAYAARDPRRYWDVCLFHADDAAAAHEFADRERAYAAARGAP